MSLHSYADFLFETYGKVKSDAAKIQLLNSIAKRTLNEEEKFYYDFLLAEGYQSQLILALESDDHQILFSELNETLDESILSKAKEKAAAVMAKVKEKGKEYLDKVSDGTKALVKAGGDILKPFQIILKKIGDVIKKMWEKGKALAAAAVEKASEKIREKVKSIIKDGDKKKSLLDELGNLKSMAGSGVDFLTSGFTGSMAKSAETAVKAEEGFSYASYLESAMIIEAAHMIDRGVTIEEIKEQLAEITEEQIQTVLEGGGGEGGLKIPFVSSLMDKIGHTPPFSYFHDLGAKAEKAANNALEKASYILSKVGGAGPFKFAVIGALVGVAVSYYTESGAKTALKAIVHALEHALHFAVPGFGIVMNIIKYTGIALAVYGVIKSIAGQSEKEGGEEKPEEKDKEEK
jgi:mannose/fructose-specific phosphotransferase system component IIA